MQQAHHLENTEGETLSVHRWYDMDSSLGDLVHIMESLSPASQAFFAYMLKHASTRIIKLRGRSFIRTLDWTVFIGLVKSKNSRRWYDREPVLHQAFNLLYSLSDADKALVARELGPSAELVLRYENHARNTGQSIVPTMVQQISEACIKQGPVKARAEFSQFI